MQSKCCNFIFWSVWNRMIHNFFFFLKRQWLCFQELIKPYKTGFSYYTPLGLKPQPLFGFSSLKNTFKWYLANCISHLVALHNVIFWVKKKTKHNLAILKSKLQNWCRICVHFRTEHARARAHTHTRPIDHSQYHPVFISEKEDQDKYSSNFCFNRLFRALYIFLTFKGSSWTLSGKIAKSA